MNMPACLLLSCAVLLVSVGAQQGSVHCKVGCACSEEVQPQCANNYRTYKNECLLRCEQCNQPGLARLFDGRCEDVVFAVPAPLVSVALSPARKGYVFV